MINGVLLEALDLFQCDEWGMDQFYHWMFETTCDNMISAWFWAIFAQIIFILLVLILWCIISYRFDNYSTQIVYDANTNYNKLQNKELNVNEIMSANPSSVQDVGSINSNNAQWQY